MTVSSTGVSVIVPTAGNRRLHLLDATIAGMRRCDNIDQIVIAETGARPYATEIARRRGTDHVFALDTGPFNRGRALNLGSQLGRNDILLWCDGDVLFEQAFLARAITEMKARKLDFLLPFSIIHGLGEADTGNVVAGRSEAADCRPAVIYGPPHPGTIGLVRRSFVRRHGGMIEAFRGWGYDDNAWAHKVKLLGRIGWTERDDQRIWHLFHPQATRDTSNVDANVALFRDIEAITDGAMLQARFPPERPEAPPWRRSARILFVVPAAGRGSAAAKLASAWAGRLENRYGVTPSIEHVAAGCDAGPMLGGDADIIVLFGDPPAAGRLHGRPCICIAMSRADEAAMPKVASAVPQWLLARTAAQAARWHAEDDRVWHRGWQDGEGRADAAPVLVQLLSHALQSAKPWSVRIVLDRSALPSAALDRPPFWYLALHDADGNELLRHDADARELLRLLAPGGSEVVLERTVLSPRAPAGWTIWPVDKRRRWLDRMAGPVTAATAMGRRQMSEPGA